MSRKTGKTILVVDDDRPTLSLVASLLKTLGHEVQTAVSGKTALEAVESQPPDLVLLDISLPYMDGYDVAMMLRERFGKSLPIVALTGRPGRDARRAAEVGFAEWLEKPFDVPDLVRAVNGQLRARSA